MSFDPRTGEILVYHEGKAIRPVSGRVQLTYPRDKGNKILSEAELLPENLVANPNRVLENYDALLAVDTNSKQVDEEVVSVTCLVRGQPVNGLVPGGYTVVQFGLSHCIEFWGAREGQERIGWWEVLTALTRSPTYSDSMRVGLIVDAYLGSLNRINKGEEAVFGDTYLPKNVSLIYASTDTPNEGLANKMLSIADRESKHLLEYIVTSRSRVNLVPVADKPYSLFRVWTR
jgi:hypothetical protein